MVEQMHSQVFEGHPSIYNRFGLKGRVPVTVKYHCHTDVYPWVVSQHFLLSKNSKMHLTVNYTEPVAVHWHVMK